MDFELVFYVFLIGMYVIALIDMYKKQKQEREEIKMIKEENKRLTSDVIKLLQEINELKGNNADAE